MLHLYDKFDTVAPTIFNSENTDVEDILNLIATELHKIDDLCCQVKCKTCLKVDWITFG